MKNVDITNSRANCSTSFQAEYEVTPDEKRKECGQELQDKYLNLKVMRWEALEELKSVGHFRVFCKDIYVMCIFFLLCS